MVEISNVMDSVGSGFLGFVGEIGRLLPYLFGILVVGALIGWWYYESQFNKRVLLYKIIGNSFKLIDDKAKLKFDKNRVRFWQLRRSKLTVDVPPSECLVHSAKGEVAEGYLNNHGEIVWIKHGYTPDHIIKMQDQNKELDPHDKAVALFLKSFRPVTSTQRASYAYQDDQARSYQKLDFFKQNMPIILGGIFIILTLAVFMIFYGKIVEPTMSAVSKVTDLEKVKLEELKIIQEMSSDVQIIKGSLNITNEGVPDE